MHFCREDASKEHSRNKKKSVEKKYDLFDILSFLSSNLCNDYSSEEVGKKYGLNKSILL